MTDPETSILILGGTTEATELACALSDEGRAVTVSFATAMPRNPTAGYSTRTGPFGGVDGLVAELRRENFGLLVDATHPFAATMAAHAFAASTVAQIPHLRVLRPPWRRSPSDQWYEVDDLEAAAAMLAELNPKRALLAIGRAHLEAFSGIDVPVVVRSITAPDPNLLTEAIVITDRGPFDVAAERSLMANYGIELVVTRNSGGVATAAKITAARDMRIPVLMVRRPAHAPGPRASTVVEALRWIHSS